MEIIPGYTIRDVISGNTAHMFTHRNLDIALRKRSGWIGRPGGFGGGAAPDPIPNSAVKTPSAHGTVS